MVLGRTRPPGLSLVPTFEQARAKGFIDVTNRALAVIRLNDPVRFARLGGSPQRLLNLPKGARLFAKAIGGQQLRFTRTGAVAFGTGRTTAAIPTALKQRLAATEFTARGGTQAVQALRRREKLSEQRVEQIIRTGRIPPSFGAIGTTQRFRLQRQIKTTQDARAIIKRLEEEQRKRQARQNIISGFTREVTTANVSKNFRDLQRDVTRGRVITKSQPFGKVTAGKEVGLQFGDFKVSTGIFVNPSNPNIPTPERIINNTRVVTKFIDRKIFDVSRDIGVFLGVDGPSFVVNLIPNSAKKDFQKLILSLPESRFTPVGLPIGLSKSIIRAGQQKVFTVDQLRKIVGSASGSIGSIGSVFIRGPAGILARVVAVGASDDPVGTALSFGIGVAFGGIQKVVGATSNLLKLRLGTGASGKAWLVVEKIGTKLVPAFFVYEGTVSALDIGQAIAQGNESAVRRKTTETKAGLAAFITGARVGEKIGGRLASKINQAILFRQFETVVARKYGKGSKTYNDSIKAFGTVFGKIPRGAEVVKVFDAKFVESISKSPKAINIVNNVLRENSTDFVIIGSGVILPQTGLRVPPRKLLGDIDANSIKGKGAAKRIATQMFNSLRRGGFSKKQVRLVSRRFAGEAKFSVDFRLSGKGPWLELFNIAESPKTTFFQISKTINTFDLPARTAFRKDRFGVQLLNLRDQLRAKVSGFATGGRVKDLPDIIIGSRAFLRLAKGKTKIELNKLIRLFRKAKTTKKRNSIIEQFKALIESLKKKLKIKGKEPVTIKDSSVVAKLKTKLRKTKNKKNRLKIIKKIRKLQKKDKTKLLKIRKGKIKPSRPPVRKRSFITPFADISNNPFAPSRPRRGKPSRPPSKVGRPSRPSRKIPPRTPSKPPKPPSGPPFKPPKPPSKPPKPPSKPPKPPSKPPKPPSKPPKPPSGPPFKPPKPPIKPPIPPEKPPIFLPGLSFKQNIDRLTRLRVPVNLIIRKNIRGKVKPVIVKRNLFANEAVSLGRFIVDQNKERTYRIQIAKKGKPKRIKSPPSVSASRFRSPKGRSLLARSSRIEKSKFSLSQRGEKEQITRKGLEALRRKKLLRKLTKRRVKVKKRKNKLVRKRKPIKKRKKKAFNVFGKNVKITLF